MKIGRNCERDGHDVSVETAIKKIEGRTFGIETREVCRSWFCRWSTDWAEPVNAPRTYFVGSCQMGHRSGNHYKECQVYYSLDRQHLLKKVAAWREA